MHLLTYRTFGNELRVLGTQRRISSPEKLHYDDQCLKHNYSRKIISLNRYPENFEKTEICPYLVEFHFLSVKCEFCHAIKRRTKHRRRNRLKKNERDHASWLETTSDTAVSKSTMAVLICLYLVRTGLVVLRLRKAIFFE